MRWSLDLVNMKSKKQKKADAELFLAAMLNFGFSEYRYRYESKTEGKVDKSSWESRFSLMNGERRIIVDRGCESHFVPFIAEFIGTQYRSTTNYCSHDPEASGYSHDPEASGYWMLFKGDNGLGMKGYWLVRPQITCSSSSKLCELKLELSATHFLGKNKNKRVVLKEESALKVGF